MALFVAVAKEAGRVRVEADEPESRAASLRLQLEEVHAKVANLVEAIATHGASEALSMALAAAEAKRDALRDELAITEDAPAASVSEVDWEDSEARLVAITQTVRRIIAEPLGERWFSVEFHDRVEPVTWRELPGGECVLENVSPENKTDAENILRARFG